MRSGLVLATFVLAFVPHAGDATAAPPDDGTVRPWTQATGKGTAPPETRIGKRPRPVIKAGPAGGKKKKTGAKPAKGKAVRFELMPGPARAIRRSRSASRDAPVFEFAYGPSAQGSVGGEFGIVKLGLRPVTLFFGMYAMIVLENEDTEPIFPPSQLWRGLIGFTASCSIDVLARRWFKKGGAVEVALLLGHESDHGEVDDPPREGDMDATPGGDFIRPDFAVRVPLGRGFSLTARVQNRFYFRGGLTHAPGGDLILRWDVLKWLAPVVAIFGEGLFPREKDAKNGFFFRGLGGAAFPGKLGEVTFFGSVDVGNGKGLLHNRREVRLSLGVRYAPF